MVPVGEVQPPAVAGAQVRKYLQLYESRSHALVNHAETWVTTPEIPTASELCPTEEDAQSTTCLDMPVNKIDGPWESKAEYLRSHYQLLREDAISSLRDAVEEVKDNPGMSDSGTFNIYEKVHTGSQLFLLLMLTWTQVHILGFTFSTQGIATKVAFSTARAGKRILWEQSKRLVSSSLVVLTPANDMFQTVCKVAIVAARPLDGLALNPPEVDLFFAKSTDLEIDPQQEWVMLQSQNGYFESYRHTLTGLQRLMIERWAFLT